MISRRIVGNLVTAIAATGIAGISSLSSLALATSPARPTAVAPTPTAPASATPSSATSSTPSPATVFSCIRADANWATVARRGPNVTPPMIRWTTTLGNFTPEERCKIVSNRLTRAVAETGRLRGLMLTYGRVNGSRVVCYVRATNEGCSDRNILFTLRPGDDPDQVLRRIVAFSIQASGAPVQQSSGLPYLMLGEAVESCLLSPGACSPGTTPGASSIPSSAAEGN